MHQPCCLKDPSLIRFRSTEREKSQAQNMNNWKFLPSFLVSIQCLESVYGIDRGDSSQVEKLKFDKPLEEIFESAVKVCVLLEDFSCNIWHVHVGFIWVFHYDVTKNKIGDNDIFISVLLPCYFPEYRGIHICSVYWRKSIKSWKSQDRR